MTFIICQSTYKTHHLLIAMMTMILLIYYLLLAHENSTSYDMIPYSYGAHRQSIDLYGKIFGSFTLLIVLVVHAM